VEIRAKETIAALAERHGRTGQAEAYRCRFSGTPSFPSAKSSQRHRL